MDAIRNNILRDFNEIMRQKVIYSTLNVQDILNPLSHIFTLGQLIGKTEVIIRSKLFSNEDMEVLQYVLCFFNAVKDKLIYNFDYIYSKYKNIEFSNYLQNNQFFIPPQNNCFPALYRNPMNGYPYNPLLHAVQNQTNNGPNTPQQSNHQMRTAVSNFNFSSNRQNNNFGYNHPNFQQYPYGTNMPDYQRNLRTVTNDQHNFAAPGSSSASNTRNPMAQSKSVLNFQTMYISSLQDSSSDDEVQQIVPQKKQEEPKQHEAFCQTGASLCPPPIPPKPLQPLKKFMETQTTPSLFAERDENVEKNVNKPSTSKDENANKKQDHIKAQKMAQWFLEDDKNHTKKHRERKDSTASKRQSYDSNKVSSSTQHESPKKPKLAADMKKQKYMKENPEIAKIIKKYENNIKQINDARQNHP